ncbi:site-2 protease family protein [Desertibaculum subflavum]|uniref:site-2 protease family protein n=1 Tax=Desertibaculum subflavum TaxID=2268458 RepID=UPI000E660CF2
MFGRRIAVGTLLGFEIRFDLTWLILVALIVWTLSVGYFPGALQDLSTWTYIWMGLLGAFGLFASIILHELAHSVVGRRLGMDLKGITLFAFGGAAEMAEEPRTPRTEFLMTIAGPATSAVLAALLYLASMGLWAAGAPLPAVAVTSYLAAANLIIAIFNLIPAFPLDGGRILRAGLWAWRGDLTWATRIATAVGGGLGLLLIVLGVINAFYGNLIGGMWWFLIGLFIRAAASASYQRVLTQGLLEGVPVHRLMRSDPVSVSPQLPISQLIEDYLLGRGLDEIPVVADDRLIGSVGVGQVKSIAPADRESRIVGEIAVPAGEISVSPDAPAAEALEQMQRAGRDRLLVVQHGELIGLIALRDLLGYLSARSALRPERATKAPSQELGSPA